MKRKKKRKRSSWPPRTGRKVPARSPFGCTGEVAEHLESVSFTRGQERRIARAVNLARDLALARGEVIDANEAMRRISETWLQDHRR